MITNGTEVTWISSAAGRWLAKTGHVIEVVPAGKLPSRKHTQLHRSGGVGMSRNHESYVVEVVGGATGRSTKLYWPRAAALEVIGGPKKNYWAELSSVLGMNNDDPSFLIGAVMGQEQEYRLLRYMVEEITKTLDEFAPLDSNESKPLVQRVKDEMHDFRLVMDHCSTIYDHVTRGRISTCATLPRVVTSVADEIASDEANTAALDAINNILEYAYLAPEDWLEQPEFIGTKIMDPDGWRYDNKPYDAPIQRDEFRRRLALSAQKTTTRAA